MEQLRAGIEKRVSNERMIQEEIRTCARQNFETILLRDIEIKGLKDKIQILENQLADQRHEYDRLMMEGEDTFAQYHREWRVSDERRYQLKKLTGQINSEGKLKQQLAKEL